MQTVNDEKVLEKILEIEISMGRIRTDKWHERIIDIDVLFFNDQIVNENDLVIPHPFIQERMFVLMPLSEIANSFIHPLLNKTIGNLISDCKDLLFVKKYA